MEENPRFVVCVKNDNYPASLQLWKIYRVIADEKAEKHNMLRIVDESGEDYLYSAGFFVSVELPKALQGAILASAT